MGKLWAGIVGRMVILFGVIKRERGRRSFRGNYEMPFNSQLTLENHRVRMKDKVKNPGL